MDPRSTLGRLQAFLDLSTPFSDQYRRFDFTGRQGDPSATIRSGRIVRGVSPHPSVLQPDQLERLETAFRSCADALMTYSAPSGRP